MTLENDTSLDLVYPHGHRSLLHLSIKKQEISSKNLQLTSASSSDNSNPTLFPSVIVFKLKTAFGSCIYIPVIEIPLNNTCFNLHSSLSQHSKRNLIQDVKDLNSLLEIL